MADNTISLPDFESLNLNNDTAVFSCLEPRAASVAFSVFQAINLIYHFRPRSQWWALQILSRQAGEVDGFEVRHKQWRGLWSHLSDSAVESKVSVYNRRLKEDQAKVGFRFVNIQRQKPIRKDDGSYVGMPTFYGEGDFWDAFRHVQNQYLNIDLLALPRVERLARYVTIIEVWGENRNYKPIIRERKEKNKSEKSVKEKSANGAEAESAGITVTRAMSELQQMPRSEQFQFVKDFTEEATSHLIADSQDYIEGAHIFSKVQTAALIGGKHSLDDLRMRIAKHNGGRPSNSGMRAAALRASQDKANALMAECEQLAALCETSDAPDCADYWRRWAESLKDFRWAITEDRKGRAV